MKILILHLYYKPVTKNEDLVVDGENIINYGYVVQIRINDYAFNVIKYLSNVGQFIIAANIQKT